MGSYHGYDKEYYQANKERIAEYRRANWDRIGRTQRSAYLKKRYKITIEEYETMLETQNGVCAICKSPCPSGKSLAVDHDHACCPGKHTCGECTRGLLCITCNRSLGWLENVGAETVSDYLGVQ